MSYKLVDQVIALDVGDATAKLVLILIARHADNDGTGCVAGQETLAAMAGCTTRTIFKAMAHLARSGLIRRRRRFRQDGTRTSDETLIAVDTTGRIFRWSTVDHRKETTSTTGKRRGRPPEKSSEQKQSVTDSVSRSGQRESAQNRDDGPKPDRQREPRPVALSDPEMIESWKSEARTLRPDLTDQQIDASLTVFRDHYQTGHQTAGRWRNWIRNEDPTRRTERGQRVGRDRNAARLFGTDYPHEAPDQTIDPATIIDSTCRAVPD